MSERKNHKKLVEDLKKFVQWELKNSEALLEKNKAGEIALPEKVEETAILFYSKDRLNSPGVLTVIYLAYLDYKRDTTEEERMSINSIVDKYGRYADALIEVDPAGRRKEPADVNIRKEALEIISIRNARGERRYSDIYNSTMLIKDSGEDILYCGRWKKWLLWDGCRWKKDDANDICEIAVKSIRKIHRKAVRNNGEEQALTLMDHAAISESTHKIDSMVKAASWNGKVKIRPDDLDRDNMIFNCKNGSIDLVSGRLLKHDRKRYITKLSPVEYDENAECPVWKEFLKSIFKKNKVLIQFVQKVIGMCLTGDTSAQAMFILYGTGANGKSTFINTIMKIMGDYGANTPTETLMQKKVDTASNDIARLQGARFVSAMEADFGGKLAEALVKRLTGSDTVSARFLYGEYFEFMPTFKIFMATNHKPKITGMDNAIWRRIKLIPFEVSFNEKQQDQELPEKLAAELPGILAWIVEGCILWQKEGLGNPPAIIEATNEYRNEMSAIETFLQECCLRDEQQMIQASHLYEAYKNWAEENNERIISMRSLGMRLAESGMDKTRLSSGNHWIGIALNK